MNRPQHGGARSGAGRKPQPIQRVKRAITLSVTADAIVLAHQQPGEPYSQTVERLLSQIHGSPPVHAPAHPPMLAAVLAQLTPEYQVVAVLYRALGWSRQQFEQLIQTELGAPWGSVACGDESGRFWPTGTVYHRGWDAL